MSRNLFAHEGLSHIPHLLTFQDRNPHSPTYGCFDRNYWHYKSVDFPGGMSGEFVWPLTLAYSLNIAGNAYFQQPALREWIEAGLRYTARSAHADGSCDDTFPFEKSVAATAFALLAGVESYALLGMHDAELLEFFARRADWLAGQREGGRFAHHHALILLCLEKTGGLLDSERWDAQKAKRLARVLELQNEEGWFAESADADPGCHTLTLGLLAQLHEITPTHELRGAIERGVKFAAEFVHPDGSFGGEYTSRGTHDFFPHGFEFAGAWMPGALTINDCILAGLARGLGACHADDRILARHAWSCLLAWKHWVAARPPVPPRTTGRVYFKNAGLLIERRDGCELYLSLNKGGVFKFWRGGDLVASDTQLSVQVQHGGTFRNAVAHLAGRREVQLDGHTIVVRGKLRWAKARRMTTFKLIVRRMLMLTAGRIFPSLIRLFLHSIIVTGKRTAPFKFTRTLAWSDGDLRITDELNAKRGWATVCAVGIGAAQSSIHADTSHTFQSGQIHPWLDFSGQMHELKHDESLTIERVL